MADDRDNPNAFKHWYDPTAAKRLAKRFAHVEGFRTQRFLRAALKDLDALEMMDRVRQWSAALRRELPEPVPEMLAAIVSALPPVLEDDDQVTDGFLLWPLGQLIGDHAAGDPVDVDVAMHAMMELTQRFSSEFAVRPFVAQYPEPVLAQLLVWTSHPSRHVRRWCSEGTRPRLPWGARLRALDEDPTPVLPILEALRDDPELYVRRSVANHLNDIAKAHPALVLKIARRWWKKPKGEPEARTEARRKLVRHALRSLIKAGDPKALAVLGYRPPKDLRATLRVHPQKVAIGGGVQLTLELHNAAKSPQSVLIDYRVHYVKANGEARPKVFKWTERRLGRDESVTLEKKQHLRVVSIRPLYAGKHAVDVLVNGEVVADTEFALTD